MESKKRLLFRVEGPDGDKRIMVHADSVQSVISSAVRKFGLPEEHYKVVLKEDGTEIDDDEVLESFNQIISNFNQMPVLKVVRTNSNGEILLDASPYVFPSTSTHEDTAVGNGHSSHNQQKRLAASSETPQNDYGVRGLYSLQDALYKKISHAIMEKLQRQQPISSTDRADVVKTVSQFLEYKKDTSSQTVRKMAKAMIHHHPSCFEIIVNGKKWSDGEDSLILQITNRINYQKTKAKLNSSRGLVESESRNVKKRSSCSKKQDEYGCVEYAPQLPDPETSENQEEKRVELIRLYEKTNVNQFKKEIEDLMDETYPTVRAEINEDGRNLVGITNRWPFLKHADYLLQHASRLLGKDIIKVWNSAIETKTRPISNFMKLRRNVRGKEEFFKKIFNDCETAMENSNSQIPNTLVIFPLLIQFFEEKLNYLFKIVDKDTDYDDLVSKADSMSPVLIVKGNSMYDEQGEFYVIIEKHLKVRCTDFFQGILITFLTYYVFGFVYPIDLEKTLEFLQREFLEICPQIGGKKSRKRQRRTTHDASVLKLCKLLYSSELDY